jgi:hypothetical protein
MTAAGSSVWNMQRDLLAANTETMLRLMFGAEIDCTQGQGAVISTAIDDYLGSLNRDGWSGTLIWILAPTFISYETLLKMPFTIMKKFQKGNVILRDYIRTQIRMRKFEVEGKEGGIVAKGEHPPTRHHDNNPLTLIHRHAWSLSPGRRHG